MDAARRSYVRPKGNLETVMRKGYSEKYEDNSRSSKSPAGRRLVFTEESRDVAG